MATIMGFVLSCKIVNQDFRCYSLNELKDQDESQWNIAYSSTNITQAELNSYQVALNLRATEPESYSGNFWWIKGQNALGSCAILFEVLNECQATKLLNM